MPAGTASISALDDAARDVYPFGSKFWQQYNKGAPTLDLLFSGNKLPPLAKIDHEGRRIWIPMDTDFNPNSAVATAETGGLPEPGHEEIDKAIFNLSVHSAAFQMSALAMETLDGNQRSVANMMTKLMDDEKKTVRRVFNWLMHQDGSGQVAAPTAYDDGTGTFTVPSTTDFTLIKVGTHLVSKDIDGTQRSSAAQAMVVTAVTSTTIVVEYEDGTIPAASAWTDTNDRLYRFDQQGEDINGLSIICSNANPTNWGSGSPTYGNINRSTNEFWQGYSLAATATGSTTFNIEDHVQPVLDTVNRRAPEEVDLVAFVRYDNWRAIGNQLSRDQRTNGRPQTLTGGWKGIQYENCMFVRDRDCPATVVRFADVGAIYRFIAREWYWDDTTGSIWAITTHPVNGRRRRVYRADMHTVQQVCTSRCVGMAQVTALSASA